MIRALILTKSVARSRGLTLANPALKATFTSSACSGALALRSLLLPITLFHFTIASAAGNLGNQFVTAKLAYGASIDLPRSWQVARGNEMRAIETAVGAAIDLSGYARLVDGTESLLVSSFPDG